MIYHIINITTTLSTGRHLPWDTQVQLLCMDEAGHTRGEAPHPEGNA